MEPDGRMPGRSREPFFHQPRTIRLIEEVAASEHLVIYVGAGVTITESGHSWSSMVKLLFGELGERSEPSAAIAETFDLPKQASIANEYFQRAEPDAASRVVANLLRRALYQEARWRGGDYTAAIGQFCKEKLASGHEVAIVTTNYDQYLENGLRDASSDSATAELVQSRVLPLDHALDEQAVSRLLEEIRGVLPVVHLHGVILPERNAAVAEDIVLDEVDYLRTEAGSSAVLTGMLERNDLLILGSSLEDAPLMRALWKTKAAGHRRWALFPRQNYRGSPGAYGNHPQTYDDLIYAQRRRCELFRVQVVAPDFYSQAPQFVKELAIASECARGGHEDAAYQLSQYGIRLADWWKRWIGDRSNASGKPTVNAQRKDHNELKRALDRIQKTAAVMIGARERLKLELWVRWKPSSHCRGLQLWASSTGTWLDHQTMRNEEIDVDSEFLAVRAFCNGVVELQSGPNGPRDRWKKSLAVPIRVGSESRKFQAGVIVLSTNVQGQGSIIDEHDDERMNTLIRLLTGTGRERLEAG